MGLLGLLALASLALAPGDEGDEAPGPARMTLDEEAPPSRSPGAPPSAILEASGPGLGGVGPRSGRGEKRLPEEEPFHPPHGSWAGGARHFSGEAWKETVWDGYLTTPAVLLPLGLAVSAAAISHWDKQLLRQWEGALGNKGYYSDVGLYALLGSAALVGTFFPGEGRNWWDEDWTILESFGAAYLVDYALKVGVSRPRPGTNTGTHSFPSGHATAAFTAATLIERNSGLALGLPAYAAATFTGFERIEEGRHYPSDVLAGAAIGTLFASVFDHLHWGTGPGGGGIARPTASAQMGFSDRLRGFELSLAVGF
jgi:membrane-associated phospholipid phosphatase